MYLSQRIGEVQECAERFGELAKSWGNGQTIIPKCDFVDFISMQDRDYAIWAPGLDIPKEVRDEAVSILDASCEIGFVPNISMFSDVDKMRESYRQTAKFFRRCELAERIFHSYLVSYREKREETARLHRAG